MRHRLLLLAPFVTVLAHAQGEPPVVVSGATAPVHGIAGGKGSARLLLNATNGSKEAAVTVLTLQPGAEVPEHVHDVSVEILYVQEGGVEMVVGGKKVSAVVGDAIRVPAGVKHSARVTGTAALKAVQVYVGPGPEQRFTAGPRLAPTPAAAR